MAASEVGQREAWVLVARSAKLRGARGLMTARLVAAGTHPFRPGQAVTLQRGGERSEQTLQSAEVYRDRVILQFRGVASASEAAPLAGADILLQSKDLVDLPDGTYYIFRLVGLEVIAPGPTSLGRVFEVVRTGGTDLLRVKGAGEREFLVPFARAICRRIDPDAGVIEIDPPEGLLELDGI